MTVTILDRPTWDELKVVMSNLRAMDRIEATGMSPFDDAEGWAAMLDRAGGLQWVVLVDDVPAAIIGMLERWPHVWSGYCLGTPDFPRAALSITKHVRHVMLPVASGL